MNLELRIKNYRRAASRLRSGQAMLTAVIFFLFITVTIVGGVSFSVLRQVKNGQDLIRSKESYYVGEAGLEDVLYRYKNAKQVSSTGETITLNGYSATTEIADVAGGKSITTTANRDGDVRKVASTIAIGAGVSFNYGLLAGNGGFSIQNFATVNGNVYANGDITGGGSWVSITGSAIGANSIPLIADKTNNSPSTPPNSINFRDSNATQDFAQSFQVTQTAPINKVQLYMKKVGSPASNPTVRIVTDAGGVPSTTMLDSATLSAALVSTSYGWVDVIPSANVTLNASTTYWIVVDNSSVSSSNYFVIGANTTYNSSVAKSGTYGGTWNALTPNILNSYFAIYLGGLTSTISGLTVGGDAYAHVVNNSTVSGNMYCQTGSGNNKSCNTSRSDPVPQAFPVSDSNIQGWKDEATAGGVTSGDVTISSNTTLGPRKITGNLTVNAATLTLTGTLWVQGNVIVTGNGFTNGGIQLASSYGSNSGVIVMDGYADVGSNATLSGSGQTGSSIMLLTTSNCPLSGCGGHNAIEVGNWAGAGILYAPNGTVHLTSAASATEITAYQIALDNWVIVNYTSGLVNTNFSSGPSGGWDIKSWKETQ